jgi:hypothetical protein
VVNCDHVVTEGSVRYQQMFRVYIHPQTLSVREVEIKTTAP